MIKQLLIIFLSFRPCQLATIPRKAKQDEAGAVVPDAIVNRRQKKKEKTFEYEVGPGKALVKP